MTYGDPNSYAQNRCRADELERRKARIRQLNDLLRTTMAGGRWMVTSGVEAFGPAAVAMILSMVRSYTAFTPDNDPHDEHDFGSFEASDHTFFWKIDCYDKRLEFGSPDPADPDVTARVITVMLASEY